MQIADRVRIALENLRPTQAKVDQAIKTAVEVAQPSRVIIFGSWARGDARWDSDLDLAVLMPDCEQAKLSSIHRNLRRKLDLLAMTIDLVTATEGTARDFRGSVNSIYHRILQDGQVAYDAGAGSAEKSR